MTRRTAMLTVSLLAALVLPAVPAAAGGGCHDGITQGTGSTVHLEEACPTPTILRVDPGSDVTFVNDDPYAHNIIGNLWGHYDDLVPGDAFTARFDQPGVYPYACWYHPGMTGAVVVGNGDGAGNGAAVAVLPFGPPTPSPVVAIRTVTVTKDVPSTPTVWLAVGVGLTAGLAIGWVVRRRRRVLVA